MRNWSVDTTKLKRDPEQYAIWKLEQLVNFGLEDEKLDRKELTKHWNKLELDPHKKQYLSFLL